MSSLTARSSAAVAATRTVLVPEILGVDDVSFWLRCSPSFARSLLRDGRLRGRRVGRRWFVSRTVFLKFIESVGAKDPSAPNSLRVVLHGEDET